ncbi:MAG: proline racemase [Actinobacteria bacterium]|jgi:proline racemase|nr:proline racemase [Actinomycetota bacterium]NDH12400.1 proline racemase [Actinomycetota bacterium]TRZ86532.1 MAG: proline racemase [Streptomycetaceae bacterium]
MGKSLRTVTTVESHTEGMPTRVVISGIEEIPGATMFEKRLYFMEHMDEIRQWLMYEPRGHSAMSGAILQKSTRPDADWGVVFIEVSGCLPMCGHGTIGVATVLVEKGLVPVVEPITTVRLDTPAGLVIVDVQVKNGKAEKVTLTNVPSFSYQLDQVVEVPGYGKIKYDIAFGGNFYAIIPIDRIGIEYKRENGQLFLNAGLAISNAINEQNRPVHPENPDIAICHHIDFIAPGANSLHWKNAMAIHPGWFDRSPCGTGTSARLAQMVARGEFKDGDVLINESWIGSQFEGRVKEHVTVAGLPAIVPTITGRAWVMGEATWTLDPSDPFPAGFLV